ncbi:MAG TPA: polysaccharide deacetylase family protein [bacterium]|nr:polysaccharide deacetylase family protein [bacterium]
MKILLKQIFLTAGALLGYIILAPLWKKMSGRRTWRILRYHSVSDRRRHETNVAIDDFGTHLSYLVRNANVISLREGVGHVSEKRPFLSDCVSVTFDDGYRDNYLHAYPLLREHQVPATIFLISGYIGTDTILPHDGKDEPWDNYLLAWDQICGMDPALVEFGSHTQTHFRLSRCTGEIMLKEILTSKKTIEDRTGRKADFISYPFGTASDFTPEWEGRLRAAGFRAGFLATYGRNDERSDIYRLKRIGVESSDTLFTLRAKLNGALDPLLLLSETAAGRRLKKIVNTLLGAVDYE